jgi:hypothetical protein
MSTCPVAAYTVIATLYQFGHATEYFVCTAWDRADALAQIRAAAALIKAQVPEWQQPQYEKFFWTGTEPSPSATPRRSLGGGYHTYCTVEQFGTLVLPTAEDGKYSLGMISHGNMQGWSFSLSEYIIPLPGTAAVDEDPVAPAAPAAPAAAPAAATASLPSVWTLLGVPVGKWDKYGLNLEEEAAEAEDTSSDESIDAALDHAEYYADY